MKERFNGIVAVFSCVLLIATAVFAEAQTQISAEGEAEIVSGNRANARSQALETAMIEGLLSAASGLTTPFVSQNARDILGAVIAERPQQFVRNYKLVSEEVKGGTLRIRVTLKLKIEELRGELSKYGLLYDRARRPTFWNR